MLLRLFGVERRLTKGKKSLYFVKLFSLNEIKKVGRLLSFSMRFLLVMMMLLFSLFSLLLLLFSFVFGGRILLLLRVLFLTDPMVILASIFLFKAKISTLESLGSTLDE